MRAGLLTVPHVPVWKTVNVWILPLLLLFGLWLLLALFQGGFLPRRWLLPAVGTSFFAVIIAGLAAYPRRPRQGAFALVIMFFLYSLWVACSAIWAPSLFLAWEEINRTFFYLVFFVLAVLFLTDKGARRACRYVLVAASLALLGFVVWRLQTATNLPLLFTGNRFSYPATYPNNAAAMFLMVFWPLLWIAADPREWILLRSLALGAASSLIGLAVMTQSRGAFWAFAITLVAWFACSPVRLRTLVFLMVPAVLLVWSFPDFNRYWTEGPEALGAWPVVYHSLLAFFVAALLGMVLSLLEKWVHVSNRMKMLFGGIVVAAVVAAAVYGTVQVSRDFGSPGQWVRDSWTRLMAEQTVTLPVADAPPETPTIPESRFGTLSASGRWDIWRVGWNEFKSAPIIGVGANNFVYSHSRYRNSERANVRQPHSLQIRVLSETGVVGGLLFFGFLFLGLLISVWPRMASSWRRARDTWLLRARPPRESCRWGTDSAAHAWPFSLAFGVLYWFVHGSVEWLWHMPGVTLLPLLFLALAVSIVDARALVLWPRLPVLRLRLPDSDTTVDAAVENPAPTTPVSELGFQTYRRSDKHLDRRLEQAHRRRSGSGVTAPLQPRGPLSTAFRAALIAVAAVALLSALFPFLSLRFQQSAARNLAHDPAVSIANTAVAAFLNPVDPEPLTIRAEAYAQAARSLQDSIADDSKSAAFDNLCLAHWAAEQAVVRNPADWSLYYLAGRRALDLAAFVDSAGPLAQAFPPGSAAGSLANTVALQDECGRLRSHSVDRLVATAHLLFALALERNPLHPEVAEAFRNTADRTLWEEASN